MDRDVTTVRRLKRLGDIVLIEGQDADVATYMITHRADEPCAARKLAELYGGEIAIDIGNPAGRGFRSAIATLPRDRNFRDKLPSQLKRQVHLGGHVFSPNWEEARVIKIRDKSLNRLLRPTGPARDVWLRIVGWYADAEKEEFGVTMAPPHRIYDLALSLSELGEVEYRKLQDGQDVETLEATLYATLSKEHYFPPRIIPLEI